MTDRPNVILNVAMTADGKTDMVGKAAQQALILTLAKELAGNHVTANVLRVKTIDVEHERDRQPVPANQFWTTPEEIYAALLYLCSAEAQAVNGAHIPLFGSD